MLDKRSSKRIPFKSKIKYGSSDPLISGNTFNLSEGGIGIEVPKALSTGSKIVMRMYLTDEVVRLEGEVRWVSENQVGNSSKMGIKFSSRTDQIKPIYNKAVKLINTELENAGIPQVFHA